jgi:hypothetical protein
MKIGEPRSFELTRRKVLVGTSVVAIAGIGVTTTEAIQQSSGNVSVQADPALTIETVDVGGEGPDASITRINDEKTTFQAAVEAQVGDNFEIGVLIHNHSSSSHTIEISVTAPDSIDIIVGNPQSYNSDSSRNIAADPTDASVSSGPRAVKSGDHTWMASIDSHANNSASNKEAIVIAGSIRAVAQTKAYDIGVRIKTVSSEETG